MSSFTCRSCGTDIIDSDTGYITGCPHYPKEDLTALSGKQMSDGMSIDEGDRLAMALIERQHG
jgi:hypothetical protein